MKDRTVRIKLDFMGKPFIVEACTTDAGKATLSTSDWMEEEINACGIDDVLYGTDFEDGVYTVRADGSWDYEHIEYSYDLVFDLVL